MEEIWKRIEAWLAGNAPDTLADNAELMARGEPLP